MNDVTFTQQIVERKSVDFPHATEGMHKTGVVIAGVATCALGVWAFVCLHSAIFAEDGPVVLFKELMKAING